MAGSNVGGLVGNNAGSITDKNYFLDEDGTNGIGTGYCYADNCIRAGTGDAGETDEERRQNWLKDDLDESDDDGMGWLPANWENFMGSGSVFGYPLLKYAVVDGFCTKTPATLNTKNLCEASGSCDGGTGNDATTCAGDGGTWRRDAWWLAGEPGCGGSTGVTCGDTIEGQ